MSSVNLLALANKSIVTGEALLHARATALKQREGSIASALLVEALLMRDSAIAALALAEAAESVVRTCRVCGCTDSDCSQCIKKTGAACWWVGPDLCSACEPPPRKGVVAKGSH